MAMGMPGVGAPRDERDRRQVRATYYGAQREVDDGLAPLFGYLQQSGLADSTLVVVTSDHGEMGGDHWLLEKLGFWDESYHVPLIVVDPRPEADGGRGTKVDAVTESVDVLPTICEFMGADVPLQADGWSLAPFVRGEPAPAHWRDTAHFEWSFADPVGSAGRDAVRHPHEPLFAGRDPRAPAQVRPIRRCEARCCHRCSSICPPTPGRPTTCWRRAAPTVTAAAWSATQELLQWQMRTAERTLSGSFLHRERGLVEARDTWR